jgi:hypothetical protein
MHNFILWRDAWLKRAPNQLSFPKSTQANSRTNTLRTFVVRGPSLEQGAAKNRHKISLCIAAMATCSLCACGGGSNDQDTVNPTQQQSESNRTKILADNIRADRQVFLFGFSHSALLAEEISQLGIHQSETADSASVIAVLVDSLDDEGVAQLRLWLKEGKVILAAATEGQQGKETVATLTAKLGGSSTASQLAVILRNSTGDDILAMPYLLENKAAALSFALSL